MLKSNRERKSKSTRKPLREVSNDVKANSKSSKKKAPENEDYTVADNTLDCLILVHSDLSSLIHQIDELLVQALKHEEISNKGKREIESFASVLSEMHTALKPWVPRLEKALQSSYKESVNKLQQVTSQCIAAEDKDLRNVIDNLDETKLDSLVSPSPLVSWRADCAIGGGRQLFLLTPLPRPKAFTSKLQESSNSAFEKISVNPTSELPCLFATCGDTNDDLLEGVALNPTPSKVSDSATSEMENSLNNGFISKPESAKRDCTMLVMTPCLKMSPPKSCVLLEPMSEFSRPNNRVIKKSNTGGQNSDGSQDFESSTGSKVHEHNLALKYPELFGIKPADKLGNRRRLVEESPTWMMSPPKTCILMEPPDEKSFICAASDFQPSRTASVVGQQTSSSLMKENDVQDVQPLTRKHSNQELAGNSLIIDGTPLWKQPDSIIRQGKRPGENTLKKELWTRFEAASLTQGIHFDASAVPKFSPKGFLDRLDEVS